MLISDWVRTGEKPVVYKGGDGWSTPSKGNTGGGAWGQKRTSRSGHLGAIEICGEVWGANRVGILADMKI